MKTFNFDKPYEELSFNEILSILLEIVDNVEIDKIDEYKRISYNVLLHRFVEDFNNNDELELNYLSFSWNISYEGKDLDSLKNQSSKTRNQLDSYFESAINLGLIELKFIE
jgi:hypothetical protein|nr:MAG TPA: hypothetical protein [Caudoviricetes sp.]